jgi:hypothetical protein
MKLRNGKTINTTHRDWLIGTIKTKLTKYENIPLGNVPRRMAEISKIFCIVRDNLDYIMSDEFSPSEKFIQTVYNKTFFLSEDAEHSTVGYIEEHEDCNTAAIYKQTDDFQSLLSEVQQAIVAKRPAIRAPFGYNDDDYAYERSHEDEDDDEDYRRSFCDRWW